MDRDEAKSSGKLLGVVLREIDERTGSFDGFPPGESRSKSFFPE